MNDRAAHYASLGNVPDSRELLWGRDSEANRNRQLGETAKAFDQSFRIPRHLLPRAGHARSRDRINESCRDLRDQLQSLIGAGWLRQKNSCEIILTSLAQIVVGFFNR